MAIHEKKVCTACKKDLPAAAFYIVRQAISTGEICSYLNATCKQCTANNQTKRRRQIKKQAVEYLGGKCRLCGFKTDKVVVYDFHHRDPFQKDFMISKQAKSFESIKSELDKCDLLCANCHRLVHNGEG